MDDTTDMPDDAPVEPNSPVAADRKRKRRRSDPVSPPADDTSADHGDGDDRPATLSADTEWSMSVLPSDQWSIPMQRARNDEKSTKHLLRIAVLFSDIPCRYRRIACAFRGDFGAF